MADQTVVVPTKDAGWSMSLVLGSLPQFLAVIVPLAYAIFHLGGDPASTTVTLTQIIQGIVSVAGLIFGLIGTLRRPEITSALGIPLGK